MNIKTINESNIDIAIISGDIVINDVQSAIDFIATIRYTTLCDTIIVNKEALGIEFFNLKSGLAGEVLQKFANYKMSIFIVGDFSIYSSQSLHDFIYECNNSKHIYFAKTYEEAINIIVSKI